MIHYVEDTAGEGEVGYKNVGFKVDTCTNAVGNLPINDLSPRDEKKTNDCLLMLASWLPPGKSITSQLIRTSTY